MTSLSVLNNETAPEASKEMLNKVQKNFGFVPNLLGVMAHSPAVTEAYLSVADIFSRSDLSPTEQQIVLLTVSHYHECGYCMAAHTAIAGMKNVDDDVVQAIRDDVILKDDKLQALRQFTRQIIEKRGWIDDAEAQAFLDAGYQESNILDILVGVAQKTLSNFTNHIAKTPLDDAFDGVAWQPK